MNEQQYTFTDAVLDAYLEAKQADDVIGYCGNPATCLIAQAVKHKYPEFAGGGDIDVFADDGFDKGTIAIWGHGTIPLTPYMDRAIAAFDFGTDADIFGPVTKAEFLRAWHKESAA